MATQSRKSPDTLTKSQYHHFIPRFLLRNFAKDVTDEPSASLGKGKRSKRHRNSDELVNILNFQNAIPSQRRIAKKFGLVDMYRDRAIADQHDLEEKLSKLEAQAGVIVSKARKALDGGFELVLTRFERDTIRNFFFMMKYRSSRQFERFNHQSIDTYDADDKDRLIGFLEKRNLSSPKAVWFSNIHTFLDLQMDADMNRLRRILESPLVYPDDAMMFITHMQTKFMAFCTVSDMTDEFVLSQNAYGVHEGPMDIHLDPKSGKLVEGTYTEHHTFAPLSPKLLVVFRSFWLPSGADEGDTHEQKLYYDMFKDVHFNPGEASSILGDLPVEKCRNSYSSVINGKAVLNPGPPEPRSKNKFFFRFFSLSTTHVQLINTIFFENAYRTSSMVFKSSTSMLRARRLFLEDRRRGFKVVKDSSDTRLKFLQKLETIAREMGIETKAVYTVLDMPMPESHMARFVGYIVGFSCVKKDTELGNLYGRLCATEITSFIDIDQASRMTDMTVKFDVILSRSRLSPHAKIDVRLKCRELFALLPRQQIWLYLKIMRNLYKFDPSDFMKQIPRLELKGPEDIIADSTLNVYEKSMVQLTGGAGLEQFPPHMAGQALFRSLGMYP